MYWHLLKKIKHQLWKTFAEKTLGQLVILSNGILVSNKIGITGLAAVGVSGMILLTFSLLLDSLTSVTNTKVGQSLGEEKVSGSTPFPPRSIIVQGFYLVGSLSLLLSSLTFTFAPQILTMSGANPATVAQGAPYLRILGGFYLFESLRKLCAASLQGMKDFKSPLKAGAWMNVLHIVLVLLVVHFSHLGLVGVAWATLISQVVGLLLLIRPLQQQVFSDYSPWLWERAILKEMFKESKDTLVQGIFTRGSMFLYVSVMIYVSTEAYVARRITDSIVTWMYVMLDALIAVMTPTVSTLYGERKALHERLHDTSLEYGQKQERVQALLEKDKELVHTVNGFLGLTSLVMGALAILQYLAQGWIIQLYTHDPVTIQAAQKMFLASVFAMVPFSCFCLMYRGGLNAVKDRKGSRNSTIIATTLWAASLLFVRNWGLDAILISEILFEILRGSLVIRRFYSRQWSRCPSDNCALPQ